MKTVIQAAVVLLVCASTASRAAQKIDTAKIEEHTGLKGKYFDDEAVFKVSAPRTDVAVTVDKWKMPPFMGLTSWAAFTGSDSAAMVMGDIVLLEGEVNAAMSAALDNGLEVTALHNHFFFDQPKVYFMHIGGHGAAGALAQGVRTVLDAVKEKAGAAPATSFGGEPIPERSAIAAEPLEKILAAKGEAKDGMFKATIGRRAKMHGGEVGKQMGVNTWAAFAGTDDNAVVDGDFVVLESELQGVLKSLRHAGINIVAIHHHMTGAEPRYIFLHYWGRGKAEALAAAVKSALDVTNK
jgi:uncharacterized protein DUF1259